jgi:alpha-beta hydrolase superfamily lysophospholipase
MNTRRPQHRHKQSAFIASHVTQVTTNDGVTLAGLVIEPTRQKNAAVIYVHGLHSSFTNGFELTRVFGAMCRRNGYGFFKFNNRGHDIISRAGKKLGGGGYDKFTDCIKDIDAVIDLAHRRGYKRIILMGHSTGSNKVLYYTYRHPKKVSALILTGPLSDIGSMYVHQGKAATLRLVSRALALYKKDPTTLIQVEGFVLTAERCLSLYEPGHAEDTFPTYRSGGWKELHTVTCPLLVVVGERDRHLDRRAEEHLGFFERHAKRCSDRTTVSIAGADHSFHGKEQALTDSTEEWFRQLPQ